MGEQDGYFFLGFVHKVTVQLCNINICNIHITGHPQEDTWPLNDSRINIHITGHPPEDARPSQDSGINIDIRGHPQEDARPSEELISTLEDIKRTMLGLGY